MRMPGPREPGLEQRRVGTDGKERHAERRGEKREHPKREARGRRRLEAGGDRDRQPEDGERHQCGVDEETGASGQTDQRVRIGVSGKKRALEEDHGDGPDGGRTAKAREHQLGEERLHRKEQESAQEERRAERGDEAEGGRGRRLTRAFAWRRGDGHDRAIRDLQGPTLLAAKR